MTTKSIIWLFLILLLPINCYAAEFIRDGNAYIGDLSGNEIIIGEKGSAKPKVKLTKWDKECQLEIEYISLENFSGLVFVDLDTKVKASKTIEDVLFYKLSADELEFEVIVKNHTTKSSWQFQTTGWENFDFHFQPALTQQEIDAGCERPENVVGSYAVYHKTKVNNKYQTGKFCHIYRPKFIDANGVEKWGEMVFLDGVLTITGDADWLENATYPVILDPNLGYSTKGASLQQMSPNVFRGWRYTATAGTLDNVYAEVFGNGGSTTDIKMGLYTLDGSSKPSTLITGSSASMSGLTGQLSAAVSGTISAQDYYISIINQDDGYFERIYYDSLSNTPYTAETTDNYNYAGFPYATVTGSDFTNYTGTQNRWSIWYSYTESGVARRVILIQ